VRVLLAVDAATPELWPDDRIFADALRSRGAEPVPHRWGQAVEAGATVVIRSTWDYVDHPVEFASWLDHLDERGALVLNPTSVLRWNSHKRYLVELAEAGAQIVPTELVERGTVTSLDAIAGKRGWDDVVVKPAVGASARLTVHAAREGWVRAGEHLDRLLAAEDILVQPFVRSIADVGEMSVLVVAGEPIAAVTKRAAHDDWRVQSDFGGTATRVELTEELRSATLELVALIPGEVAYARVDLVRQPTGWSLMELELVEPELFFPLAPEVAERLADHVIATARLRS
jgi:glutathione synthase/RimK-type ligase-like ATP-grasp enzyme